MAMDKMVVVIDVSTGDLEDVWQAEVTITGGGMNKKLEIDPNQTQMPPRRGGVHRSGKKNIVNGDFEVMQCAGFNYTGSNCFTFNYNGVETTICI